VAALEVKSVRGLLGRRAFIDVPFRIHGNDPSWVPPLRITVYDRLSPRHPAASHQTAGLWIARRRGKPVGRIGACIDSEFDRYQGVRWGWVGFYDSFDDPDVAGALFETAWSWLRQQGAETAVGPASFTTNDELGLMVEGFDEPPAVLTLQNPRYYEDLWLKQGWEPAMDLYGWHFDNSAAITDRHRRTLERLRERSQLRLRDANLKNWDREVGRLFEVYNAAWSENWGFAPIPEPEVRHVAKQLKSIINPHWTFGVETSEGELVGFCIALPDVNLLMLKVRSGRLLPFGWWTLLTGRRKVDRARVWALGIKPQYQSLALGPLLYGTIVDRLVGDPGVQSAEASWILATNDRMNSQIQALGGVRSRVWRLYQRAL
jgi:ribosomal protein S18 acetylase RimI-like enzyme